MITRRYQRLLMCLIISVTAFPLYAQVEVLTSIRPLGLLAEAVVGDHGAVNVLLPKGASAHHYQLGYSDRKSLNEADLVLWIGENLETFFVIVYWLITLRIAVSYIISSSRYVFTR